MALTVKPVMLGKMRMYLSLITCMMNFPREIWVPIVCWYVQADDLHVLIDTGASADIMKRCWYDEYEEIAAFSDALAAVHVSPEQIDLIIQTHLHFDHCGNPSECRNAEVVVQSDELEFARA